MARECLTMARDGHAGVAALPEHPKEITMVDEKSGQTIDGPHGRALDVNKPNALDISHSVMLDVPTGPSLHSPTSTAFSSSCSIGDMERGPDNITTEETAIGTLPGTVSGLTLVSGEGTDAFNASREDIEKRDLSVFRPLPPKRNVPIWRTLRFRLLAVYQRLFTLAFLGNAIAMILVMIRDRHRQPFGPPLADISAAVAANVTCAILMRQEYVINSLYDLLCFLSPPWVPLRIRRIVAKYPHFGGVHSGCAVSCVLWFILFTGLQTNQYVDRTFRHTGVLVITYILLGLLCAICLFAVPRFRRLQHNSFEWIHRFGGWLAVGLFWVLTFLILHAQSSLPGSPPLGAMVVRSPTFWLLVVVTGLIILPWLRLRRFPVRAEVLSSHAVRIHLPAFNTKGPCLGVRLATSPLKEWHAFAVVPTADNTSHSVIVSHAGDWTRSQIENPQSSYWIRGIPIQGVLRMAGVFKKVVCIATGSGIGPVLSMLHSTGRMPQARLIWSAPNPAQTFGPDLINCAKGADKDAIIWDTRTRGRPDVVALAHHIYAESGAEAVFIVSNPSLTNKVIYALESRGVPCYGPIWDS